MKGFTQNELAEQLGVSIAVLGAIERGSRKPDSKILQNIAGVLGIKVEELNPIAVK